MYRQVLDPLRRPKSKMHREGMLRLKGIPRYDLAHIPTRAGLNCDPRADGIRSPFVWPEPGSNPMASRLHAIEVHQETMSQSAWAPNPLRLRDQQVHPA